MWDMSNPDNSPDELAAQLVADLLPAKFEDKDKAEKCHRIFSSQLALEIRR